MAVPVIQLPHAVLLLQASQAAVPCARHIASWVLLQISASFCGRLVTDAADVVVAQSPNILLTKQWQAKVADVVCADSSLC